MGAISSLALEASAVPLGNVCNKRKMSQKNCKIENSTCFIFFSFLGDSKACKQIPNLNGESVCASTQNIYIVPLQNDAREDEGPRSMFVPL